MNRVLVSAEEVPLPEWGNSLRRYALKVLAELGRDKWDLSVLLCGDKTISSLNSHYRGKAEATDVLSFPLTEGEIFPGDSRLCEGRRLPGDIVISLDNDTEPMLRLQEQILANLAENNIISMGNNT